MDFSIIIPLKELNDYLAESVPRILALDYDSFEVLVLPNDPPPSLPPYLQDARVRVIPSGRVSPAVKRDLGAEHAQGTFLAFIDDDAYPEPDWLAVAMRTLMAKGIAAVGGPAVTPPGSGVMEQASGLFFESRVGGGGMDYRYRPGTSSFFVDDFPTVNLIVARRAFLDVGGFDNEYWPGEDTKFCLDLVRKGYKIWYANDLIVWHHRRPSLRRHLRQVGNYGRHRGYFARVFPETSRRPTYFAPSLFLLGNVGLLGLAMVHVVFLKVWAALLAVYLGLAMADVLSRTRRLNVALLTVLTILLSHLTYGAMFLRGITSRHFRSELR